MGELSPKQMRGSELDDVIFNGTSERPAWDIAEVTLDLDNTDRKAPNLFNLSSVCILCYQVGKPNYSIFVTERQQIIWKRVNPCRSCSRS